MDDEKREEFQAVLQLMCDAFVDACSLVPDWELQGELQGRFFDGYQEARRLFGTALIIGEVTG